MSVGSMCAGGGVNRGGERRVVVVAAARNSGLINEPYRGRGRNHSSARPCVRVPACAFACVCVRARVHAATDKSDDVWPPLSLMTGCLGCISGGRGG